MRRLRFPVQIIVIVLFLMSCGVPQPTVLPADSVTATEALTQLGTLPTTTLEPTPTRVVADTPLPWKTATTAPSATPLPSLTPILTIWPASTPTVTSAVPMGIKTVKQKNGTTLISDYDYKFQFVVPSDWAIATVTGKSTPQSVLATLQKNIPNANRLSTFLGMLVPETVRVVGANQSKTYVNTLYPVILRVAVLPSPGRNVSQANFLTALRKTLNQESYTVNKTGTPTYSNKLKAITLEVSEQFVIREGNSLTMVDVGAHVVIFQVANKWIVFSVAAPIKMMDKVAPMLDQMVTSIVLLK